MNGTSNIPPPRNAPVLRYAPATPGRAAVKAELQRLAGMVTEIPVIVNGKEFRSGNTVKVVAPHRRRHQLAMTHQVDARTLNAAVTAARRAQREGARRRVW